MHTLVYFLLRITLFSSASFALPSALEDVVNGAKHGARCIRLGDCRPASTSTSGSSHITSPSTSSFKMGNWAALGGSYASALQYSLYDGIDFNKNSCRRYNFAYATSVARGHSNNDRLDGPSHLTFVACSGSQIDRISIEDEQASQIPRNPSVVIVTIGSNNPIFYPVLNACTYRAETRLRDKDCDNAITDSEIILENDFPGLIGIVLDGILAKSETDTKSSSQE